METEALYQTFPSYAGPPPPRRLLVELTFRRAPAESDAPAPSAEEEEGAALAAKEAGPDRDTTVMTVQVGARDSIDSLNRRIRVRPFDLELKTHALELNLFLSFFIISERSLSLEAAGHQEGGGGCGGCGGGHGCSGRGGQPRARPCRRGGACGQLGAARRRRAGVPAGEAVRGVGGLSVAGAAGQPHRPRARSTPHSGAAQEHRLRWRIVELPVPRLGEAGNTCINFSVVHFYLCSSFLWLSGMCLKKWLIECFNFSF